jgi:hypothetical protein
MSKTASDVLTEWGVRGYYTGTPSTADSAKYLSYIDQAKESICAFCNIPQQVISLFDGLFYPWVEISYLTMTGNMFEQATGKVSSISEGDTSVSYSNSGTDIVSVDYSRILNRYRCLF